MKRKIALIIFHTKDKRILLQDRKGISDIGEEWGYFGGGLEGDETPEQALVREVNEELGVTLNSFKDIGQDFQKFIDHGNVTWELSRYFFSAPYEDYYNEFKLKEGSGMKLFTIEEAKHLIMGLPEKPEDPALDMIQKYLLSK